MYLIAWRGHLESTKALAWEAVLCVVIGKFGIPSRGRFVVGIEGASEGAAGLRTSALTTMLDIGLGWGWSLVGDLTC